MFGGLQRECPPGFGESEKGVWERWSFEGRKGVSLKKIEGWEEDCQSSVYSRCRAQSQKEKEMGRREGETERVKWEVREDCDQGDVIELFTHLGSCHEPHSWSEKFKVRGGGR